VKALSELVPSPGGEREPEIVFDGEMNARMEEIFARYPSIRSALLPVLWSCQQRWGWLSPAVIRAVSERLQVSPAAVEGAASFYTMFHLEPPAKYVIQVCRSLSCHLDRSRRLYEHLRTRLGIDINGTTDDRRFSLVEVQCQGLCDQAPVVQINDERHIRQSPESIDRVLDGLT
jgi:NADH-quinone oxidoreductase subunit E